MSYKKDIVIPEFNTKLRLRSKRYKAPVPSQIHKIGRDNKPAQIIGRTRLDLVVGPVVWYRAVAECSASDKYNLYTGLVKVANRFLNQLSEGHEIYVKHLVREIFNVPPEITNIEDVQKFCEEKQKNYGSERAKPTLYAAYYGGYGVGWFVSTEPFPSYSASYKGSQYLTVDGAIKPWNSIVLTAPDALSAWKLVRFDSAEAAQRVGRKFGYDVVLDYTHAESRYQAQKEWEESEAEFSAETGRKVPAEPRTR